jgi:hypothetical protein
LTDLQDLLDQIPVDQIASLLGTDTASARAAVEAAVPTLLAGLQNNAQAPDGAASLESALAQHQYGLADGGVDPAQVDTADGEKIVSHAFGGQQDQVASQLAGTANLGGGQPQQSQPAAESPSDPAPEAAAQQSQPAQGLPTQRSVTPGELIDVDLPGEENPGGQEPGSRQ